MNLTLVDLTRLLSASTKVAKKWGSEYWLTNTEKYCAKILELSPGWMCSMHRHDLKDETFLIISGLVFLELDLQNVVLYPGDSYRLKPRTWHRFSSAGGAMILEVSTEHSDEDVERREESRKIKP